MTFKRITSLFAAAVTAAAMLVCVPPVKADAAEVINYRISFTENRVILSLKASDEENRIYYTTDGSKPKADSRIYETSLSTATERTIRAVEVTPDGKKAATLKITVKPKAAEPQFDTYIEGAKEYLELESKTPEAQIYYTCDGSKPSSKKQLYTGKIELADGMTVKAVAYREGMAVSDTAEYTHVSTLFRSEDEKRVYERLMELSVEYPDGMPWSDENEYGLASGCVAFAYMLTDLVFDEAPSRRLYDFTYDEIRAGDIVRIDNDYHSVVVLEKTPEGVIVAEGNYAKCVRWGRLISRKKIENGNYIITRYSDDTDDTDDEAEGDTEPDADETRDDYDIPDIEEQ